MLPTAEQLDQLTREELLALLKALLPLLAEVELLRQRVAELAAENERLKQKGANSGNSSQPPSRDQKVNLAAKKRRKHGPPFGHAQSSRPLVENPDRIIAVPVKECSQCHAALTHLPPEQSTRRQITELPEVKPVIIETQQQQVTCPYCQTVNRGSLPAGLEAERYFGPQLEATVLFYKQTQHLSYERVVETMHNLHGVTLSEGAIAAILGRAAEQAAPVAESIRQEVISGEVIRSDETSARVRGCNWWQWVFISEHGIYHTIVPTRSSAEVLTVLGQSAVKVWVCDCYGAQLKAPAEVFQLCLAHQLRDLQRVVDAAPQELWAQAAQKLFRAAIHLRHRCLSGELTLGGYFRRITQLENQLDRLLEEAVETARAAQLQARFSLHRDKLLTFLYYPEVPPTNNESEQALRGSVVHRKVTNGFRSEWGAKAYAALQTVIATAKQKGEQVFQTLVALMGTPVLPFLEASSP
jgi:transposase